MLPEEGPPRYQVPLVRRPGRWDVPPQSTWHRPRLGEVLWNLAFVLPLASAVPVVTGDRDLFLVVVLCVGNAVVNAAQDQPDRQRTLVPELDDTQLLRVREVVAAGGGLGALPDAWQDAAHRYVVATAEATARRRRRVRWVLTGWSLLVVVLALVLVAVWPQSAPVRYPAAGVSAVSGAGLAVVLTVLGRRREAQRTRFLAG